MKASRWKNINWTKIRFCLHIFQNKVYAAKKNQNIRKLILNLYGLKKVTVHKVTQLNCGNKTADVTGIKNLNEKQRV